MSRARELALAGFGLLLLSSTSAFAQAGRQCAPAVSNPEIYTNCRLTMTREGERCRCALLPAALRPLAVDRQNETLGLGGAFPGPGNPPGGGINPPGGGGGPVVGGGTNPPGGGGTNPPGGGGNPPGGGPGSPPGGNNGQGPGQMAGNPGNEPGTAHGPGREVGKAGEKGPDFAGTNNESMGRAADR
jgi:hypothetical protein